MIDPAVVTSEKSKPSGDQSQPSKHHGSSGPNKYELEQDLTGLPLSSTPTSASAALARSLFLFMGIEISL